MFFFCNLSVSTPYVAGILLAVLVVWILAVRSLGRQFNEKTQGVTLSEVTVKNKNLAEQEQAVQEQVSNEPLQVPA